MPIKITATIICSRERYCKQPPVEHPILITIEKPGVLSADRDSIPEGWGYDRHGHILCPKCEKENLYDY